MAIDSLFGTPANALLLREKRAAILANNLANSSTPNFKARDMDFKALIKQHGGHAAPALQTTNTQHINSQQMMMTTDLKYRIPGQPSADGNTVDPDIERVNFLENAMQYQVNLTFIRGTVRGLMSAIKGE